MIVLNKLERVYVAAPSRQTDFEIVGADKRNPTTLSLKPVPKVKAYDPGPALAWGIRQLDAVAHGAEPDERIRSDLAFDLVKLAAKESEYGYRAFWINGHTEAVRFDEQFHDNALRVARSRVAKESPTSWRTGTSQGSVVGVLRRVDDLEGENEFVVVPPVGPERVVCIFPEHLRAKMGTHLFQTVRVKGLLHYGDASPYPFKVDASDIDSIPQRRKAMSQMKGLFAGRERVPTDWDELIGG